MTTRKGQGDGDEQSSDSEADSDNEDGGDDVTRAAREPRPAGARLHK